MKIYKKQYKNIKPKIIVLIWNDNVEIPDGFYSVSDILEYIEYIIKKRWTLTTIPPIHAYINRINNGLMLRIKDEFKLKWQTPDTLKLRKKLNLKKKLRTFSRSWNN